MTVKELKLELREIPDDFEVYIENDNPPDIWTINKADYLEVHKESKKIVICDDGH